jgi:hypothetical protein
MVLSVCVFVQTHSCPPLSSSTPLCKMAAATAEIVVDAAASSMTAEDARLFDALTNEEGRPQLSRRARQRFADAFLERISSITSRNGGFHGGASPSVVPPSCAALLDAFTPAVLRRLVLRMDNCIATGDLQEVAVTAHTLLALRRCAWIFTELVDAGILPICARLMRRGRLHVSTLLAADLVSAAAGISATVQTAVCVRPVSVHAG